MSKPIHTLWIDSTPHGLRLRWADPGHGAPAPRYLVFADGALFTTTADTSAALQFGRPGQRTRVAVLRTSAFEASAQDWSGLFAAQAIGSRLRIGLPAVDLADNPTFASWVIYWSSDGSDPTVQLSEVRGAGAVNYTTPALTEGVTYKFRSKSKDLYGNLGDYSDTVSGTVATPPLAPTGTAATYTQATRTAVITSTKPVGQAADVVGYRLYSNHLPGSGLQAALTDIPLALVGASATVTFTTGELSAGLWRFAWRAVDGTGLESSGPEVTLNLVKSAGNLVEIVAPPAKPVSINAAPIAGGKVRVTVKLAAAGADRTIKVYRDGALDGSVATTAGTTDYTYDTAALVHGTTYSFYATVTASGIESQATDAVTATAYATAPALTPTITLMAVQ